VDAPDLAPKASCGVVIDKKTMAVGRAATEKLRAELKAKRGEPKPFDFGPSLQQILKNCKKETGLAPPQAPGLQEGRERHARLPAQALPGAHRAPGGRAEAGGQGGKTGAGVGSPFPLDCL
jgi:hypothetical protein